MRSQSNYRLQPQQQNSSEYYSKPTEPMKNMSDSQFNFLRHIAKDKIKQYTYRPISSQNKTMSSNTSPSNNNLKSNSGQFRPQSAKSDGLKSRRGQNLASTSGTGTGNTDGNSNYYDEDMNQQTLNATQVQDKFGLQLSCNDDFQQKIMEYRQDYQFYKNLKEEVEKMEKTKLDIKMSIKHKLEKMQSSRETISKFTQNIDKSRHGIHRNREFNFNMKNEIQKETNFNIKQTEYNNQLINKQMDNKNQIQNLNEEIQKIEMELNQIKLNLKKVNVNSSHKLKEIINSNKIDHPGKKQMSNNNSKSTNLLTSQNTEYNN